jgi:sigma-E factor negative regulatory protein RseB
LLKTTDGEVDRNYRLERGGLQRCAGFECRVSTLLPRDDLRWGYRLWSLRDSQLLVKAQTLDAAGHVINQVAFTELKVNVAPRQSLVRDSLHQPPGYAVEQMKVVPVSLQSQGWALSSPVPGFKTVGVFRRSMSVGSKPSEVLQWLLSDGLASVSIFVQPAADLSEPVAPEQRVGGTLALSRRIGDSWLTVMGAVPERTLRRISEAIVRVQ